MKSMQRQRNRDRAASYSCAIATIAVIDINDADINTQRYRHWLFSALFCILLCCAALVSQAETTTTWGQNVSSLQFTSVSLSYYQQIKKPNSIVNRYNWEGQHFRDESYPMQLFDEHAKILVGDKAFTALMSRSVRSLWKDYREGELYRVAQKIPEPIRNGGFDGNVKNWDYSLRLSDDDFKLKLDYEFY